MADAIVTWTAGGAWTMETTTTEARAEPEQFRDAGWDGTNDRELVRAAAAGSREAFDELVVRHRRSIYQLCYRFMGHHEDAADLTQEVFVRAYRGSAAFKGESAVGTWLYRIGVNACLNRLAVKTPSRQPLDAAERLADHGPGPEAALLAGERAARVRRAVAHLPDRQRVTLILRVFHDLPHREIASILGSSVGAVKANFFHALQNLKRLLADEREGGAA